MAEALSLVVGDRVVYPNQGLCKVTAIDTREIAGQKLVFVSMTREEDGSKMMVPQAKVLAIGVRKVASTDDVTKVFAFLKSDSDKASLDWKMRARTNVERMATGGLLGLAEVVKGLQVLSELRPLPTKERGLYNDARHLLVTEIGAALKIPDCDAEDSIDAVMFPVGKERPKRTAEEFKLEGGDDLLGDDMLGLDGDLPDEEAAEEPAEADADAESSEEAGEEEETEGKKPKKKPVVTGAKKSTVVSDVEVTAPSASPLLDLTQPRKRGRPPKPKPAESEPPPPPKKRGRPPKPKPLVTEPPPPPKKRGRPPKKK